MYVLVVIYYIFYTILKIVDVYRMFRSFDQLGRDDVDTYTRTLRTSLNLHLTTPDLS